MNHKYHYLSFIAISLNLMGGLVHDEDTAIPAAGNANARNLLGAMFQFGQAVEISRGDSILWCREAAIQGDARGQSNLARMLMNQSTDENRIAACQRLTLSAEQNEITAIKTLETLMPDLTSAQIS